MAVLIQPLTLFFPPSTFLFFLFNVSELDTLMPLFSPLPGAPEWDPKVQATAANCMWDLVPFHHCHPSAAGGADWVACHGRLSLRLPRPQHTHLQGWCVLLCLTIRRDCRHAFGTPVSWMKLNFQPLFYLVLGNPSWHYFTIMLKSDIDTCTYSTPPLNVQVSFIETCSLHEILLCELFIE